MANSNKFEQHKIALGADGTPCYRSVQYLSSSRFLYKYIKIEICRTAMLPVILYGCGTSSLTLKEQSKLKVLHNKVLERIFGPKEYTAQ